MDNQEQIQLTVDFAQIRQQITEYTNELNQLLESENGQDDAAADGEGKVQLSKIKEIISKYQELNERVIKSGEDQTNSIWEQSSAREDQGKTIENLNKVKREQTTTIQMLNKEKEEQINTISELKKIKEEQSKNIQELNQTIVDLEIQKAKLDDQMADLQEENAEMFQVQQATHFNTVTNENNIKKQQELIGQLTIEKYEAVANVNHLQEVVEQSGDMMNKYRDLNDDLCEKIQELLKMEKDVEVHDFLAMSKEMASIKDLAYLQKSMLPIKKAPPKVEFKLEDNSDVENQGDVHVEDQDDLINEAAQVMSDNESILVFSEDQQTARQSMMSSRQSSRGRQRPRTQIDKQQLKQVYKKCTKAIKTSALKLERGQLLSPRGLSRNRSRSPSSPDGK